MLISYYFLYCFLQCYQKNTFGYKLGSKFHNNHIEIYLSVLNDDQFEKSC